VEKSSESFQELTHAAAEKRESKRSLQTSAAGHNRSLKAHCDPKHGDRSQRAAHPTAAKLEPSESTAGVGWKARGHADSREFLVQICGLFSKPVA
jgi:hypothetical protein